MDFIPSTNLKILRNVPLDSTYKDTLTFENKTDQYLYFAGKAKVSFDDFTFQRLNSSVRVPTDPNSLYDCNYIMFQNENFGDKWFYAFIKEVNYMNPNVSEIVFEIDVMQTWYFSFNIKPCFVEREHVNNDNIGEHTVPENLETGGYVTTSELDMLVSDLNIYILSTDTAGQTYWKEPGIVGGFPVPTYWASLGSVSDFSVSVLKLLLEEFASQGKSDAIVAVFTAPSNMVSTQPGIREQVFNCAPRRLTYTPKNNKLFTYPYCCLSVSALGQGLELKYEMFSGTPSLKIRGGFGANMQVSATPINYEGQTECMQYTLSIKDFPLCAWVTNYYQNWLAQNKASMTVDTINAVGSIVGGVAMSAATGSLLGAGSVVSGISQIAGVVATNYEHSIIPNKMTGAANAADIFAVSGKSGFYSYCRAIRPEYAKIIDDYFSMFGYKVNSVKVPNITGRRSWNFVKTINSVVTGSIPVDSINKIRQILDNGITFWHGDYVGNYDRDNSILNPPPTPDPDPDPDPDPPVEGFNYPFNGSYPVTSFFGWRDYPADPYHTGVDFATPLNTNILASKSGTVTAVITSTTGFGKHIKIDCGDGFETLYAHLNSFNVSVGDVVTQGQLIAKSGNTGLSTGPHLHFQINKDGTPVDPFNYLP